MCGAWLHRSDANRFRRSHCYIESVSLVLEANEELLSIPAAWLEGLLASDDLEVDDEEIIYDALKRWHAAQQPAPTPEALCRLLALVRWPLISHNTQQNL